MRRGRTDHGRDHLWFDAWIFQDRRTGAESLWITRRIQEQGSRNPVFEVITVGADGSLDIERYRTYQLGASDPLFRATQFVRDGTSSAVPLSMLEAVYFWPLLLFFPIGTLCLGISLLRGSRRER